MTDPFAQFQQPQYAPPPMQQGYQQPQFIQPPVGPQYGQPPMQQGYGQQPGAPVLAQAGSFDDFWEQPQGGEGKSINLQNIGDSIVFQVTRNLTRGDIRQQTNRQQVPQFTRDGQPKWVLLVPGRTPQNEMVVWWVKGQARAKLREVMTAAGCVGEPKGGDTIGVKLVDLRKIPNFSDQKIVDVAFKPGPEWAKQPAPAQQPAQSPATPGPAYSQQPAQAPIQPQVYGQPAPVQQQPAAPTQAPAGADLFSSLLNS